LTCISRPNKLAGERSRDAELSTNLGRMRVGWNEPSTCHRPNPFLLKAKDFLHADDALVGAHCRVISQMLVTLRGAHRFNTGGLNNDGDSARQSAGEWIFLAYSYCPRNPLYRV